MRVSAKSWHGRVYLWWQRHPRNGSRWAEWKMTRPRLNLCHYVRAVLLYAPAYWLAYTKPSRGPSWLRPWQPLALTAAVSSFTVPAMRWPTGTWRFLECFGLAAVGVAAMLALAVGLTAFILWRERRDHSGPSFAKVSWEFVKTKKRRVCPFIDIVEQP